jgi:hypothetical protein
VPTSQRNLLARIIVGESTAPIWARPSLWTPRFSSLDSSNFITVDKPPASLWIMGISARLFGFTGTVLGAGTARELAAVRPRTMPSVSSTSGACRLGAFG